MDESENTEAGEALAPVERGDDAGPWVEAITEAEGVFRDWHERCDNVDKAYASLERLTGMRKDRELQMFWANIEVLRPSIYARLPVPVVSSRFRGRVDLPRIAADVLERVLKSDQERDQMHAKLKLVRDDLALPARGAVWLSIIERGGVEVPGLLHVDRRDFLHGAARNWLEVPWVARRAWLTEAKWRARFQEVPEGVNFDQRALGAERATGTAKAHVWEVWDKESARVLWINTDCRVVLDAREPLFSTEGFFPCPCPAYGTVQRGTLMSVPDMAYYRDQLEEINELTARMSSLLESLRLRGFYPGGQRELTDAIDAAMRAVSNNAILIPVSNFAALGNASLKESIVWLPVAEIAGVIQELRGTRSQLIEDVYQITGVSDIMRGATDPGETLGAQQLKSQYGSVRVRERQGEMVRLATEILNMKAEIYSETVPVEALLEIAQVDDLPRAAEIEAQVAQVQTRTREAIAQIDQAARMKASQVMEAAQQGQMPPQAQPQQGAQPPGEAAPDPGQAAQAIMAEAQAQAQKITQAAQAQIEKLQKEVTVEALGEFLAADLRRRLAIDVETDSTIEPDQQAEKASRVEFTRALSELLGQAMQAVKEVPALAPFLAETLRFVSSGFKVSRAMDEAIDELADQMGEIAAAAKAGQGEGQQEDPATKTARIMAEAEMMRAQTEARRAQAELQMDAQEGALELRKIAAQIEKIQAEIMKIQAGAQAEIAARVAPPPPPRQFPGETL